MRVVHVYHDVWPVRGGIEDYLGELSQAQAAQGMDVTVLCANDRPFTHIELAGGVRFVRAAAFGRLYAPLCPSWPGWIRRLQPDLLHLHLPCPLGEWAVWLARPRRLIVSLHNDYVRPRWALWLHRPVHRAVLRRADAIIVAAPDYAGTSAALAGLENRLRIVPYGVRRQQYAAPAGHPARREGVLYAGRLCYYKGVEILLEAASAIQDPITIVGDGPWRRRLEVLAERYLPGGQVTPCALHRRAPDLRPGAGRQVTFCGAVDEARLIACMHASRVFVFPSTERSEAFGLAQLKAMASGLPVVSTDLPGVAWLNRDGVTGLTVPPRNAKALADAVNRLLSDEPLRERLAAGALERANELGLEQMLAGTARVYAEAAEAPDA